MPMVRSICPSFLGTLILAILPATFPVFSAVLGGIKVFFDSDGLLLTDPLDVVSGFLFNGGVVEFGLGYLLLLLLLLRNRMSGLD